MTSHPLRIGLVVPCRYARWLVSCSYTMPKGGPIDGFSFYSIFMGYLLLLEHVVLFRKRLNLCPGRMRYSANGMDVD